MLFSGINSFISSLQADPLGTVLEYVFLGVCILLSLILHECAHGYVALKCGDPTAWMMGRLSLNPAKHLDPIGTLCMVFLRVGWAKPVPVNPRNFRHYRRDYILVSIAGIAVNFLLFLIGLAAYILIYKYTADTVIWDYLLQFFAMLAQINIGLAIFNLIPVPPLDGWGILTQLFNLERYSWWYKVYQYGQWILLLLIFANITDLILGPAVNAIMHLLVF